MKLERPSRSGFTLVEIMIILVIIALLLAMIIPAYQKIRHEKEEARAAEQARLPGP